MERSRCLVWRAVGAVALTGILLAHMVPASADVPPPSRVVSNYETVSGKLLHRDGGISVPLPPMPGQPVGENRSLWLFGDTLQTDAEGHADPPALPFSIGTFGAIGPYTPGQVPTSLSHVASPPAALTIPNNNAHSPLVQAPSGLKLPNGSACTGPGSLYQATWPFGATRGPQGGMTLYNGSTAVPVADGSQLVFITVVDVCVYDSPTVSPCADGDAWSSWEPARWTFQRTRLLAYQAANNTIVAANPLFQTTDGSCLPWQQNLSQPLFADGFLYLLGSDCTNFASAFGACLSGAVTAARVPTAQLHDPAAYRWASGTSWIPNYQSATTVLPSLGQFGPLMLDIHSFALVGEGFLLMEQTSFGGHYNLYEATTPAGPWTLKESDAMPGCRGGDNRGCYALYGHPELSTPGHLMYSFHNRDDPVMEGGELIHDEGFVKVTDIGLVP
jgi:hypothetical protein